MKKPRQLLAYCNLENAEREGCKRKASCRALIVGRYQHRDRRMTVVIHNHRFMAVCKLGRSMVYAYLSAFLFYLHLRLIRFMDFLNRKERRGTGIIEITIRYDRMKLSERDLLFLPVRRISSTNVS